MTRLNEAALDLDLALEEDDEYILSREMLVNLEAKRMRLAGRYDACADVLRALNLEGLLDYIDSFNPSAEAPYHNAKHEAAVVTAAYEGGRYHGLNRYELRSLVIAAALHDFDHSAGELTDDLNIKAAIDGLYLVHRAVSFTPSAITESELALAERLIKVTEFKDDKFTHAPQDLLEGILRDADLMMPYVEGELRTDLFLGLRRELETAGKSYSAEDFADGVAGFYKTAAWHSAWAIEKAATQGWPQRLESLRYVLRG